MKAVTINQILSNKENRNFYPYLIKIDIEGHESQLFENNIEWIDQFKVIIIETHDWMCQKLLFLKGFLNKFLPLWKSITEI